MPRKTTFLCIISGAIGTALLLSWALAASAAPLTSRVSVNSAGIEGNNNSGQWVSPALSGDGRFIAFQSEASNLVASDTNGVVDIFVHDQKTHETSLVSVSSSGAQGNAISSGASISRDGRYIAFASNSNNLVAGDSNNFLSDVFVHDRQLHTTTLVSVSDSEVQGNSSSSSPSLSADGMQVAFSSYATNLDSKVTDNNGESDIFIRDRNGAGNTIMISKAASAVPGNGASFYPAIAGNGKYVAFVSYASNLVTENDINGNPDCFVNEVASGLTILVSQAMDGTAAGGYNVRPAISENGLQVAFSSWNANVVANDTNNNNDVFVHDFAGSQITRVSLDDNGNQLAEYSEAPSISANGRFVSYYTPDPEGETMLDMMLFDRQKNKRTVISVNNQGGRGNGDDAAGVISPDGNYVAFSSYSTNLVTNDTNNREDIFMRGPLNAKFPWLMFLPAITAK